MKIPIITDTHFGARSDSDIFYSHQRRFYDEVFFPYVEENDVDIIFHAGDLFEHRKYINIQTWKEAKHMFFDRLGEISLYCIAGNHDCYYKNTNEINSLRELLADYKNIKVVDERPHSCRIDNIDFHFAPWITNENYTDIMEYLLDVSGYLIAHLEIEGFSMYKGMTSHSGLSREIFKTFDTVFTGHYHHRSKKGNIQYVGAPYEMCWSDAEDPRGFAVFDTEKNSYEFINNPNKIYHKIKYDKELLKKDLSYLNKCFVKLIIEEDMKASEVNNVVSHIQSVGAVECSVIDLTILEDSSVLQVDDETTLSTIELFDEFILNNIDMGVVNKNTNKEHTKEDLSKILKDIYQEAIINDITE